MPSELPVLPPETRFAVDYNAYVDGHYNRDLGGKGTLVVRADEPRFVFSGRARGTLFISKTTLELAFRSEQIWNVVVEDRGVRFSTALGKSGAKQTPFVFTCDSPAAAVAIAALLPSTKDAAFAATDKYFEQLRALPGGGTGLRSVTNLLLLANAAVFVAMGFLGAGWFDVASMNPYIAYGANNPAVTLSGQWWRLLTCMFMHYGLLHLLLNAWALYQVGHIVERLFSRALFTLIYFGSGLIASIATLLWKSDTVWSAGASGAVFGVYGALLGYLVREKHGVPAGVFRPLLQSTLVFAGYNLFYGAVHPHIDNAAHLGGLLGGALLGWICALPVHRETRERLRPRRGLAGLTLASALVVGGAILAHRLHR